MSALPSLTIISHTAHHKNINGEIVGWEPTVREINHLSNIFDKVYHVAPLYSETPHKANAPYTSDKIKYIPIIPTGGKGILEKLGILFYLPFIMVKIIRSMNKTDWVHFRAPTNLGILILPLWILYRHKKKWVKYAGNWKQKDIPISYACQRWWLSKNIQNSFVTINGKWLNQQSHLLTFANPCFSDKELINALTKAKNKDFHGKLVIGFVGQLVKNKGIDILLDSLQLFKQFHWLSKVLIVGDGVDKEQYMTIADKIPVEIVFKGWVNRKELNKIYEQIHIQVIPSKSEGLPKVLGESAAFGCVPIVSEIPAINQYINPNKRNGLLISEVTAEKIYSLIKELIINRQLLRLMSNNIIKITGDFTYEHYIQSIEKFIINQ